MKACPRHQKRHPKIEPLMAKKDMTLKDKKKKKLCKPKGKYLKPGALARICSSKTAPSSSCTDIGKKRVLLDSKKEIRFLFGGEDIADSGFPSFQSPERVVGMPPATSELEDDSKLSRLPPTPKTPQDVYVPGGSQSRLECLPIDLLLKILCCLHHDQLKAVFHVSRRIRKAVLMARHQYFNYTTPDRSRQEMLLSKTPLPTEHWPFINKSDMPGYFASLPRTPKAPRHGPRPPKNIDMRQIAAVLFPDSARPTKVVVPHGLPRPICKPSASNRVLFHEEDLCQAVAQNKLC